MQLTHKLPLIAAMALTALVTTAASAGAAPIEVRTEPGNAHCPPVTIDAHHVEGGCHIEFESTGNGIPMHALTAMGKMTIFNCEWRLEAQLDENGEGYVTDATLAPPHGGVVLCPRTPCDEYIDYEHIFIPWRVHLEEHGVGNEEIEIEFCLRPSTAAEGSAGLRCEVHLEFTDLGGHNYEAGHIEGVEGTEEFCENNPPNLEAVHPTLPTIVSIEPHLVNYGAEKIEVLH